MQNVIFFKYEGAGNDFILLDGIRHPEYRELNQREIEFLCHRKFGIGADGLMILAPSDAFHFEMIYFNSDGRPSSMCGNGGRCIAAFAKERGYIQNHCTFQAPDGIHTADIDENGLVRLSMNEVQNIHLLENDQYQLDTGSPHYVQFTEENLQDIDMVKLGKLIRYSPPYELNGINVNAVKILRPDHLQMRTYERGVEDETLSCGTGVTAAALAYIHQKDATQTTHNISIQTNGGILSVQASYKDGRFTKVVLTGPATFVFEGKILLK